MRPLLALFAAIPLWGAPPAGVEFFEKNIRPLLAERCYSCHSSKSKVAFAGLRLDTKAGALSAVTPGDPEKSRLLQAVRGTLGQRMPPTGALKAEQIAALARWVEMGAPWPEETAPSASSSGGFDLQARRASHWAWKPVVKPEPPHGPASHPIDRFLQAALAAKGLKPAAPAPRRQWIRRVTFDLTGLPPTPAEIAAYEADGSPGADARVLDRLLDSPHFGERFARRWMDLVRYSESHGSEGDPDTPGAWRYRDYLIRAFNADVPYDQLIREHLAGDLLPSPRLNARENLNESILGAAHLRMVEHGFQPVDPWEDRVKWTDNQIDVFSKAFQGLTISCARCHDHKFDAISQQDFYALFGVLASARPVQTPIDSPEALNRNRDALLRLKPRIRASLAAVWKRDAARLAARLAEYPEKPPASPVPETPLDLWQALRNQPGFPAAWRDIAGYWKEERRKRSESNAQLKTLWNLGGGGYRDWLRQGPGAPQQASKSGEFTIEPATSRAIRAIYPAGVYSHLVSRKHAAVIQSPRFTIESEAISLRAIGGDLSFAQLIVENYAVPRGGIYHMRHSPRKDTPGWVTWDVTYWKGFTAYVEFSTAQDATYFQLAPEDGGRVPRLQPRADGRSHFGALQVIFHPNKQKPAEEQIPIAGLLESSPDSPAALAATMARALDESIDAWAAGSATDTQASYLNSFLDSGLLSNAMESLGETAKLIAEYRRLEEEIPVARRAPGVMEEAGPDARLLVRGNHKMPGDSVPRRYLTALDGKPYGDPAHARLRLAEDVASPANPLTARVMANRIWASLFRRGLVRTVDNFGKLGEAPSNPELLDYLAARLVEDGWSIKKLIRLVATSQAYRMGGAASPEAMKLDPGNALTHYMPIRRLEAEEIRDAILSVSGELDRKMYGPSVNVYYAHDTGATKGDRPKGPLDGAGRRSVYLEVRRNAANPFLEAFDMPKPASTRGERDVTNVPAQSLALLNGQFVLDQADKWGRRLNFAKRTRDEKIRDVFEAAYGRLPSPEERNRAASYLAGASWEGLVHAILNTKEFLYVR